MNKEQIDKLIERFLAGETSPAEEERLALALRRLTERGETLPTEWEAASLMLGELALGAAEYDAEMGRRKLRRIIRLRWISAAACIALVVGLALSWHTDSLEKIWHTNSTDSKLIAEAKETTKSKENPLNPLNPCDKKTQSNPYDKKKHEYLCEEIKHTDSTDSKLIAEAKETTKSKENPLNPLNPYDKKTQSNPCEEKTPSNPHVIYAMLRDDAEEEMLRIEREMLEEEFREFETEMKTVLL